MKTFDDEDGVQDSVVIIPLFYPSSFSSFKREIPTKLERYLKPDYNNTSEEIEMDGDGRRERGREK